MNSALGSNNAVTSNGAYEKKKPTRRSRRKRILPEQSVPKITKSIIKKAGQKLLKRQRAHMRVTFGNVIAVRSPSKTRRGEEDATRPILEKNNDMEAVNLGNPSSEQNPNVSGQEVKNVANLNRVSVDGIMYNVLDISFLSY